MAQRTNLKPITEIEELKGMVGCQFFGIYVDYRRRIWLGRPATLIKQPYRNELGEWEITMQNKYGIASRFLDCGAGKCISFDTLFPYNAKALAEAKKLMDTQNFKAYIQCIEHTLSDSLREEAQLSDEQVQEEADLWDSESVRM